MPEMLIGGEWRQGAAKEDLEVINPATEEVVDTSRPGRPTTSSSRSRRPSVRSVSGLAPTSRSGPRSWLRPLP